MEKKHIRLWLLLLCLITALSVVVGCSKKKTTKVTTTSATTTSATTTEATTKEESTQEESKKETETESAASETTAETTAEVTTEETSEATTKATSEVTTEATTEESTKKTKKTTEPKETTAAPTEALIDEDGEYTSKDDVALYIHTYGHLPKNFVTKKVARDAGWEGGSLEDYYPGCSIGGDVFGNREGSLPKKSGRTYYECDIDTKGKKSRGAKRIVFSNDGLVYYTDDHYETFTLLYGEVS